VGIGRIAFEHVRVVCTSVGVHFRLGARDDSLVIDYVYRRGHFVVVLAVASESWDWADARGCDSSIIREGVSVSVYVYACAVYGFVVDCSGFVAVFLPARRFGGCSCGVGLSLLSYRSVCVDACLRRLGFGYCSCGVGLSLLSYRSVGFARVRGGTYFLCRRKESKGISAKVLALT
jgi:hypothetical protein